MSKERITPDYCSPELAPTLVERIKAHWAAKGYHPIVTAELPEHGNMLGKTRLDVRSDMVNGLPRKPETHG